MPGDLTFYLSGNPAHQINAYVSEEPMDVNLAFAFVPTVPTAAIQTTTINASITAYSTAVGPSSETRNRFTLFANLDIVLSFNSCPHPGIASQRFYPQGLQILTYRIL